MQDDEERFRAELRAFLQETNMARSTLGRVALNDSAFVTSVLSGKRSPGLKTTTRLRAFMKRYRTRRSRNTKEKSVV